MRIIFAILFVLITGGNATAYTWTPIIGIPEPPFGITTTHTMYANCDTYKYDYGDGPVCYRIGPNGPYTHYVDPEHPNATNTDNPYGTHTNPRVSYPAAYGETLPAGSVVEVHGSGHGGGTFTVSGTSDAPIFIRGASANDKFTQDALGGYNVSGSYYVFENIKFNMNQGTNTRIYMGSNSAMTHIAIRDCEFYNGLSVPNQSYQVIRAKLENGTSNLIQNVIVYNNVFHDCGEGRNVAVKNDAVAVSIDTNVKYFWIVNNEFYRIGGDGIQIAWDSYVEGTDIPSYIYVGKNTAHDNYENFIDLKMCEDVIVSQNTAYNFGDDFSSYSGPTAIPFRYGSHASPNDNVRQNIWTLFNTVYNSGCSDGAFYSASQSDESPADEVYYIGNIVYNSYNTDGKSTAFFSNNQESIYWLNNVVYNCDRAFFLIGDIDDSDENEKITMINNIVSKIHTGSTKPYGLMISGTPTSFGRADIKNNIFYDGGSDTQYNVGVYDPTIEWTAYSTYSAFCGVYPGFCTDSMEDNPDLADAANADFRLKSDSPAINAGTVHSAYATFKNRYGISIQVDFVNRSIPNGGEYDIGAYEYYLRPGRPENFRFNP